jgi:hypothetical protein
MAEEGEQGVRIALGICGASDAQTDAIIDKGFNGMSDVLILEDKEVTDRMSNNSRPTVEASGLVQW